ncbi:tumor necrosis factor receptor superfamily member 14-like [Chanos chanos]|uniref:Tumor necrosis factor receptor superfamily member 14-like n=1 Tax=Chanos chanos TaxID=29144 RepID=A0A6J2WAR6_CHACN|nr:tumor necrosis factor receptor superfamily member 14-like [Chanos chanos]
MLVTKGFSLLASTPASHPEGRRFESSVIHNADACGKAEYEVNGECCPMCGPGYHVYRHCSEDAATSCKPCSTSTFTDLPNRQRHCFPCTVCDSSQGLRTKTECTSTADTICEPREGFYCIDQHKHSCRAVVEHSKCKPGQYIKQKGTADTDTVCGDCVGETYSDGSFSSCLSHTQLLVGHDWLENVRGNF